MGILDGKTAIVTGAGRGIGREHALLIAKEGAAVVVNDLGGSGRGEGSDPAAANAVVDEIRSFGGTAEANVGNVSNWRDAAALVAQTIDAFGSVDILVNNAGILRDRMSFNMDEQDWDAVIDVVLKGTFVPSRFVGAHWRDRHKASGDPVGGVIINTASESGLYGNAGQSNYAAAKAGVAALSLVLARELSRLGSRCNVIAPLAATRLLATVRPEGDSEVPVTDPRSPAQISPLVAWLASDMATDVNGQVFAVSGERIQLIRGWRPVTELRSEGGLWSPEGIENSRTTLLGNFSSDIPPFMPAIGWA